MTLLGAALPLLETSYRGVGHSILHAAILRRLRADLDRPYIPVTAVVESLAGAGCYAASSVLQHQAAAAQPPEVSLRPGLLLGLVRSSRWLLGNLLNVGGFVLQFLALRRASLALVEPLFVASLVFSIVGSALANRRRPTADDLLSSSCVTVGLVVFLAVARPGPGHPRATATGWLVMFAVTAAVAGGSVVAARRYPRWRSLLLGIGAGVVFAVTASITERTGHLLNRGALHALVAWPPYALLALAVLGLMLNQSAYHAGDLRLSLPAIATVEPLTAILIGQALFAEHIDHSGPAVAGEVFALALMITGVIRLVRANVSAVDDVPALVDVSA